MSEEWRPVVGYEGSYEVNDHGVVRSLPRTTTRGGIKKPYIDTGGYIAIGLSQNGKVTGFRIHRLVAEAFLGTRPPGLVIRHLDGDKSNNHVSNLCYGTQAQNMRDMAIHGTSFHARKTHCPAGHEYDSANTVVRGGRRICAACRLSCTRAQYAKVSTRLAEERDQEDRKLRSAGLVPTAEAAEVLGVAKASVAGLLLRFPDFPRPVRATRGQLMSYFDQQALVAWRARHPARPQARRRAA